MTTDVRVVSEVQAQIQPPPGSVARGVAWALAGRITAQALQFATGLVVARLILPADMGLLALVYLVTGFAVFFFDLGVPGALIQQRELTQEDLNTGFWLNALGGIGFVAVLAAVAPLDAWFFADDRLLYLTPLGGLSFLMGMGVVQFALFSRQMQMRPLVAAELAGAAVSSIATVVLVVLRPTPSSLLLGPPLGAATMTGILWALQPWRPTGFVNGGSLRKLWRFSGGALASSLVWYVSSSIDTLAIGRFVGKQQLGYYNRAYNLMDMPLQQVNGAIGRVLFPALAAMGDDLAGVCRNYRRAVRLIAVVVMPMLVGLVVAAPGLTPLLWGPRWAPAAPIIQALCVAGLALVLSQPTAWLYESQGRTGTMAWMNVLGLLLKVPAVAVGLQWGAWGVAVGLAVSAFVLLPFSLHVAGRVVGTGAWPLVRDNLITFASAVLMGAATWWLPDAVGMARTTGLTVLAQVLVGVTAYGVLTFIMQRPLLIDVVSIVLRRR